MVSTSSFASKGLVTCAWKPARWVLERDGRNLAGALAGLKEVDEDAVGRIRDYLALINEDVNGFDVATYGEYETVRFDLNVPTKPPPISFDAGLKFLTRHRAGDHQYPHGRARLDWRGLPLHCKRLPPDAQPR